MNRLTAISQRVGEFWNDNKNSAATVALGALGLVGLGISARIVHDNAPELKSDTSIIAHHVTDEWPGWTPDGVEPISDMNGAQIGRLVQDSANTAPQPSDAGARPLTSGNGE